MDLRIVAMKVLNSYVSVMENYKRIYGEIYYMYKICKTEQSISRQRYIADELIRLMTKRRLSEITISELCAQADIPRKTFYRYFDTLEDVVTFKIEDFIKQSDELNKASLCDEPKTYIQALEEFLEFWQQNDDFIEALCNNQMIDIFIERMICAFYNSVDSLQYIYHDETLKHIDDTICFHLYGLFGCLIHKRRVKESSTASELASELSVLFTQPLYREQI